MVDTIQLAATGPAPASWHSNSVLQGTGRIGGMFLAVVLLVALGLAAVAVWQGGLSELVDRLLASFGSESAETAAEEAMEAQSGSAEVEPIPEQGVETAEEATAELTDREVVLDILEENDGRMKQALIVESTDWSKSKVSMVLSEMEEDGDISKLRVGRENIISQEGSEPEAAGSPFDDK